jgi:hypothetical protein
MFGLMTETVHTPTQRSSDQNLSGGSRQSATTAGEFYSLVDESGLRNLCNFSSMLQKTNVEPIRERIQFSPSTVTNMMDVQQKLNLRGSNITAIMLKSELFIETAHYNSSGKTAPNSI